MRILRSRKVQPQNGSTSSSVLNKHISFRGCDIGDAGIDSVGSALENGLNIDTLDPYNICYLRRPL